MLLFSDCVFSFAEDQSFDVISTKIQSATSIFLIPFVNCLVCDRSSDSTVKDVLPKRYETACKQAQNGKMDHTFNYVQDDPIAVELLDSVAYKGEGLPTAPVLSIRKPVKKGCVFITVPIDTLVLVHWDMTLGDLSLCLKDAICQQLKAIKEEIFWKVLHFYIKNLVVFGHYVYVDIFHSCFCLLFSCCSVFVNF